jgi:putative membrane protein
MHALVAIFDADALPQNLWAAWSFPVVPFIGIALLLVVYVRGWFFARRTRAEELPEWRLACFLSGLGFLWIALASPIDALDDYLLAAHMIQHFILMSIAPPLIVLGAPTVPLLRGLPRPVIRLLSRPLFRSGWFHWLGRVLTHPVFAFLAMNIAYLGWHVPMMFELTFRSERIHDFEHLCFFLTSMAFWWVVIAPWPTVARWPRWTVIPYLLGADILNTVLSATLAFAGRVLYPSYAAAPRIMTSLSPLKDQVAAGSEMWVLNSIVMLAPAVLIILKMLEPKGLTEPVMSGR